LFNSLVNKHIIIDDIKVYFQTRKANSSNDYRSFLFFLRFFFGFGRQIGFFVAGGKLAAAILSL